MPPGVCIAVLGAGLSLINFGIDEIADPRLRAERPAKLAKLVRRIPREPAQGVAQKVEA